MFNAYYPFHPYGRKKMTEESAVKLAKVFGYTEQPDAKVALVNSFKEDEERLLRKLDALCPPIGYGGPADIDVDLRWLAIARTDFQRAYMAINRAVFQLTRIELPEDSE